MSKVLFANGDSWAFGSEIAAPEFLVAEGERGYGMGQRFKEGQNDYQASNDYYRIPRIWPTHLGRMLDADVVNGAWPARSNDVIFQSTMAWLLQNYVVPQKDPSDLTVVIGWSTPERKNVVFQDNDDQLYEYVIWPAFANTEYYDHPMVRKYFEFHVQHFWTEKETITRFVEQNLALHQFCKLNGIKHYFFNSFYVGKRSENVFDRWVDVNISDIIKSFNDQRIKGWIDSRYNQHQETQRVLSMWDQIPPSVFLRKDEAFSFKMYIEQTLAPELRWVGIHPSPEAHAVWAEYLLKFIRGTP